MIKQKTKERKKPKYNVLQNAFFTTKELWSFDKPILFYIFGKIPIIVLLPLCSIYLPKIIASEIEVGAQPLHMVSSVGIIAIAMLVLSVLQTFISARIDVHTIKVTQHMEMAISTKAMDTDYEIIDRPSTQVMIKKAYDIAHGQEKDGIQALFFLFSSFLANILGFTVYTGILSTLSPLITLFILISAFVSYFVNTAVNKWVVANRDQWLKLDLKLVYLTYKSGSFEAAKDIRLYNMKQWFSDAFHKFMNKRIRWTITMQLFYFLANATGAVLTFLRDGAAYIYLIYLVFKGSISVSDFILYFGVIAGFSTWCMEIISNMAQVNQVNFNICDLRAFLELPNHSNPHIGLDYNKRHQEPYEICLEQVSYCYEGEDTPILKDLNLTIKPGEKIALVGANGAGKTTLVKLICGLYRPTSGTLTIGDHTPSEYKRDEYYKLFSPVFQDIRLLPISIEKNITLCESKDVDRPRLLECLRLSGFDQVVDKLQDGLSTLLIKDMDKKAIQLSGGEEQKLMLARALYKDAPFIVLDEPTAALDPLAEADIYSRLNDLIQNKTAIYISHRLSSCCFCNQIAVFDQGELIQHGTHKDLLETEDGLYHELWNAQAQYYA